MISYVLLVFITISLSIGVYIWLKDYANVSEKINCKDGTSLIIENYNIEEKPTVKILNISIKNNGLFNVSGFLISAGNDSKKIPMQLLWPRYQLQPYAGYFDFEGFSGDQDLGPGQKQNAVFNVTEINKLEVIQIQPYIFKDNNIDKVFCEQALIKQIILINPSLIPGLVSWWKFDGNVLDYGDDNDGTNNGATYVNGRLNQGLKFDGIDDYVSIPNSFVWGFSGPFSVSAWIKTDSAVSGLKGIVTRATSSPYPWYLRFNNNNLQWGFESNTLNYALTPTIGTWYHIAAVWNGTNKLLYINGTFKANNAQLDAPTANNDPVYIGMDYIPGQGRTFNGTIDEVAVYNRALSGWEVLQLYNSYNITS